MKIHVFISDLMIFFTIGLTTFCNSKVVLKLRIYNYGNENDIKHDGKRCEAFHWLNDNCDPMFDVCVTAGTKCDILKYTVDHWKNKMYITNVLQKRISLGNVQRSFSIAVKIDDHDKLDAHDHIAMFSANFDIAELNVNYDKAMTVSPSGLSVKLHASITMQCDRYYYGENCDIYCKPQAFNYDCNTKTGEKQCSLICGPYGECQMNEDGGNFKCGCFEGWTGDHCQYSTFVGCGKMNCDLSCTNDSRFKTCRCKSQENGKMCRDPIDLSTAPIKLSTKSMTTRKLTTYKSITSKSISTTEKRSQESITTPKLTTPNKITQKSTTLMSSIPDESTAEKITGTTIKESKGHGEKVIYQSSFSPTTIVIICMLLLLCACVISLLVVIRGWRKKDKINNNGFFKHVMRAQMPLPPVTYDPKLHDKLTGSVFTSSHLTANPDAPYDQYTTQSDCQYDAPLIKFDGDHYKDDLDTYEQPVNNADSNTCGTDFNDDASSTEYEEPKKMF